MTSVAIRTPPLFVSTIASPSKAASLGLSPISTTTAKPTETPTKLKSLAPEIRSNNDDDEANQDSSAPSGLQRCGSWTNNRAGFSPRPKRPNNHSHNPARRPVQSARSIHALRLAEQNDDDETEKSCEGADKTDEALGRSNQAHLERIQEAEDSDDETENDSDDSDAPVDEYDGDGEEDDALQLYKSFSGDLVARHTAAHRSHAAYDHDDDDVVRI